MERVFSVEDIPDPFWAPPLALQPQEVVGVSRVGVTGGGGVVSGVMDPCSSEWSLEELLNGGGAPAPATASQEASVLYPTPMETEVTGSRVRGDKAMEVMPASAKPAAVVASTVLDPVEYNAMLKRKLDEDLAAVAMWRASGGLHPENSLGSRVTPNSVGSSPGLQNYNGDSRGKQGTSCSSGEPSLSDDDDMEGEAEAMGNMNLDEEKLKKRKESNRESARRSRSRKAAHLKDLEDQVSLLRVENSSLLRRLADVNQKYNDSAVDNRVLRADIETLRAKVKMAEDNVKRITSTGQLPHSIPNISSLSLPFGGTPSNATSIASVPIRDNRINYFATATNAGVDNSYIPEVAPPFQSRTTSLHLQCVGSMGHVHNRLFGGPVSSGYASWGSALLDPNEIVNMDMQ